MPSVDPDSESKTGKWGKYVRYSHVGSQFFLAIAIFTFGGYWLDQKCGTVVLFTLLGLAAGFGGGFYSMYKTLFLRDQREDEADGANADGANANGAK